MNNLTCEYCNSEDFYLQFSGEHIKAICQNSQNIEDDIVA